VALSLSICIPTFNRAALLRETLLRLEQIAGCFREIVIADNASADATAAVVAELRPRFAALTYFRHAENCGMMPNFHAALSLGTSDLLLALGDDDAVLPERIADAVALLEADADCVAVFGGYERSLDGLASAFFTAVPQQTGRFTAADVNMFTQIANTLTFPLVRRTIFQRHCFYDDGTFGMLRVIAQLVRHGAVRVVDYPLYRHRDAAPGNHEARMSEPWYLEFLRADWEAFMGMLGQGDLAETAQIVSGAIAPVYLMASHMNRERNRPLDERNFLVRCLAYTASRDPAHTAATIANWEKTRLIAAAMERLAQRLALCSPLERVIIEQARLNIAAMWAGVAARFPGAEALALEPDAFARFAPQPGDFLLAEEWATLERAPGAGGLDRAAVLDLIASLRLPGSHCAPLLIGPAGTPHFSNDAAMPRP
jgi:glycosyltransferase involved in cell wall biosynthesis